MQYGRVAAWFAAWMVLAIATECLAEVIPNTGQVITPLAPAGAHFDALNPGLKDFPDYTAGQAVTTAVSPDGKTLLVLTSGYNLIRSALGRVIPDDSTQFIFSYDVSAHTPRLSQVIKVPNSYNGLAFSPSGRAFYVPGGVDDNLHVFARDDSGRWAEADGSPIGLGHDGKGIGLSPREAPPQAAGVAVSADGNTIVVANYGNDSISLLRRTSGAWHLASELDLRPNRMDPATGDWIAGGEYPYWVVIKGNDTAYVSSVRDREVVVVDIRGTPRVASRIKVPGQPNKMVLSRDGLLLFVAQDNTDSVGVIDLLHDQLVENISVTATRNLLPPGKAKFKGADTNSVTLSPDGKNLYVTNGTMNDVAVLRVLDGNDPDHPHVVELLGLIPTGWYPNSVSMSSDGKYMYVVNGKSVTGPNPKYCKPLSRMAWVRCRSGNQFGLQLAKAGFQYFPTPDARSLARLTEQAAENNHFGRRLSKQA
ncbi:MAG TPA: beta-propeller fold lactonase family protein, partial [Pseudomonadales bacterium]|nr:beta-propeller fold lactonase family protein [Pseudomonadales bacterium]